MLNNYYVTHFDDLIGRVTHPLINVTLEEAQKYVKENQDSNNFYKITKCTTLFGELLAKHGNHLFNVTRVQREDI